MKKNRLRTTTNIKNIDINNLSGEVLSENLSAISKKPFEKPSLKILFFELGSDILSLSGGTPDQEEEYW